MKIRHFTSDTLTIDRFDAEPGQAWCILGSNRSGIDTFFKLLTGQLPAPRSCVCLPDACGVFSFEAQQALFEKELKNDDTDFMDRLDPGTLARQFIKDPETHRNLIAAFDLAQVLDQGYRQLSTGQSRKLLLLSQISKGAQCLLIQSPYDGLDPGACSELNQALGLCADQGMLILIFVNNPEDVPDWATHIGIMAQGRLTAAGPRKDIPGHCLTDQGQADFKARLIDILNSPADSHADTPDKNATQLVCIEDGQAGYQGKPVFKGLNLGICPGQHTLVYGPNGCGKSTLIQMITGDHPACYQNRLWVFGIRRGTGESIWELKQNMGIVSHDLHRNYLVPGSVLDCVLSGLYDSIGLYTTPTAEDQKKGMTWLERVSLAPRAHDPFRQLCYADQRLVLIARALIKLPNLLLLDEPTQGLDRPNRHAVLDFLEEVAQDNISTILYVSHRNDENRPFFIRQINMADFSA
jgi:molybdate transport system ATP-binding protein